ncbi:MAG: serine--tRNA ligase [Erysipelotrichaceae bacterium]|jgi:seryl-tRNA synthetase|nr:serine--tRNA ligase [Erysipelotrichaceae bacterium]
MLDINLIRENPNKIKESLAKKGWDVNFDELLAWDKKRKELLIFVETNKAEQNRLSKSVPEVKKNGGDVSEIFAKVKDLGDKNKNSEVLLADLEHQITDFLAALPNTPDDDLLSGGKENNKAISTFGEKPVFDFNAKDHVELAESLGLIDFERGAKIAGRGSWIYTGLGAQLEWALINFFISEHLKDNYEFMLPPHLLNEESGYVAGQFPKFKEDVFWLEGIEPARFLLPTAETALVNVHRNEILSIDSLPRKYFAYTPCYRREAGSYRTEERGTIRGYQFNKVEMVQYTTQEGSDEAFIEMVGKAERLVQALGLHYHVSKLASGDISHSMARTYDIEVWIPSIGIYKEVSSVSNARDYQARRGGIRYKDKETGKTKYVHTLNGSGLATSRVFPALLEQHQQADGSVLIPECLWPFMGGVKVLKPKK